MYILAIAGEEQSATTEQHLLFQLGTQWITLHWLLRFHPEYLFLLWELVHTEVYFLSTGLCLIVPTLCSTSDFAAATGGSFVLMTGTGGKPELLA